MRLGTRCACGMRPASAKADPRGRGDGLGLAARSGAKPRCRRLAVSGRGRRHAVGAGGRHTARRCCTVGRACRSAARPCTSHCPTANAPPQRPCGPDHQSTPAGVSEATLVAGPRPPVGEPVVTARALARDGIQGLDLYPCPVPIPEIALNTPLSTARRSGVTQANVCGLRWRSMVTPNSFFVRP